MGEQELSANIEKARGRRRQWGAPPSSGRRLIQAITGDVADTVPEWVAWVAHWLDTVGTDDEWTANMRRLSLVILQSEGFDEEVWQRLDYRCRLVAVEEATAHCGGALRESGRQVALLLSLAAAGDTPAEGDWGHAWKESFAATVDLKSRAEQMAGEAILAAIAADPSESRRQHEAAAQVAVEAAARRGARSAGADRPGAEARIADGILAAWEAALTSDVSRS